MKVMSKQEIAEFEELAKPLIKYLNDNWNPHTIIKVDSTSAEILHGNCRIKTEEFIKD